MSCTFELTALWIGSFYVSSPQTIGLYVSVVHDVTLWLRLNEGRMRKIISGDC